jgi:hypothetical protein
MPANDPKRPDGLGQAGQRLWEAVLSRYELAQHEALLLEQACRVADRLDQLADMVEAEGLLVEGRTHPALVESRAQQITLARLLAALRVPDDDTGQPAQRRGVRGVYRLRSVR